jgi:hypothetical protein
MRLTYRFSSFLVFQCVLVDTRMQAPLAVEMPYRFQAKQVAAATPCDFPLIPRGKDIKNP